MAPKRTGSGPFGVAGHTFGPSPQDILGMQVRCVIDASGLRPQARYTLGEPSLTPEGAR